MSLSSTSTHQNSLSGELALLDALFEENRHAELENKARLLLEQHPNAGIVWKLLGLSLHMQGKEALPALQTAATLLPQDAEAQINLAGALRLKGELEEAAACCHRALQARPDFAEAHNNLGVILKELGQLKQDHQYIIGFALETNNEKENALKKMASKNADIIILNSLNDVGAGFGYDSNKITIFDRKGGEYHFDTKPKSAIAKDIVNNIFNFTHE